MLVKEASAIKLRFYYWITGALNQIKRNCKTDKFGYTIQL
jgi:hypothetical protein